MGFIDWGQFLQIPVQMMLAMHGAVEGTGTWLTGIAWIAGSLFVTRAVIRNEPFARANGSNVWASVTLRAVKVALVYAGIIIVGLAIFDPSYTGYQEFFNPSTTSVRWNAAAGFFFTLLIVGLAAAGILTSLRRGPVRGEGGVWSAGLSGTLRILLVGVGGVFAFFLIAGLLDLISNTDDFFAQVVGGLLILLVGALAWTGIDVGMFFTVEAMRFFSDESIITRNDVFGTGGSEGWFLVATLIVAAAFALGGYRAARLSGSRQLTKMLQAAGIAGGGVAVTFLVATAIVGDTLPNMGAGIGLSILWTAVAAGGALIYAQSVGALQTVNINIQRSSSDSPSPTGSCSQCGADRMPEHVFCANCGNRF
jgi:hypothetical protein